MLKRLLELVSSEEVVTQALRRVSIGQDLSPSVPRVAANDQPQSVVKNRENSRLWIEDWNAQDEDRLKHNDHHWEGYTS